MALRWTPDGQRRLAMTEGRPMAEGTPMVEGRAMGARRTTPYPLGPKGYPVDGGGRRVCGSKCADGIHFCGCIRVNRYSGRCMKHGGRSPHGPAHPSFRTGAYSRYLPGRMMPSYKQRLAEESLSLRHDIALLGARIDDLLTRVDTGESGKLWTDLRALGRSLVASRDAGNYAQVGVQMTALLTLIERGAAEHHLWAEIITLS